MRPTDLGIRKQAGILQRNKKLNLDYKISKINKTKYVYRSQNHSR